MRAVTLAHARGAAATFGVAALLTEPEANPKCKKNRHLGVITAPLHLAPADMSGVRNVCAFAGACKRFFCLHHAGDHRLMTAKELARLHRTQLYAADRPAFMTLLTLETALHAWRARRAGMRAAVRPNATSDELYERIELEVAPDVSAYAWRRYGVMVAPGTYPNIMEAFPELGWYDYTKVPPRHRDGRLPANYHLTYSYDPENDPADVRDAIARGWNVAAVFQVKRGRPLPARYQLAGLELEVIDGDIHDYRPADPRGVIVGLRFKKITDPVARAHLGAAADTGEGFALPVFNS